MNKLLLDPSLDYYPQYNENKMEDVNSTAMYSDTSFYPVQLTYALPNSPDSCVSTKTPLSPSTALCNIDMPSLMAPSSSIPLPTSTPAASVTLSAQNYIINDHNEQNGTESPFYSSFFGTSDTQQHMFQHRHIQQQEEHLSPHNYSNNHDSQRQTQIHHQSQSHQHPRKKQRRQASTSTKSSLKQLVNLPSVSTSSCPTTSSPTLTTLPIIHQQNKTPGGTTKEITSAQIELPFEDKSVAPSSSSPISLNLPLQQDQSIRENEEHELVLSTSPPTLADISHSNNSGNSTTEIRRQIHIQSEQKRRAQIKCGFEELRNELPVCLNKKMSKVALLHRTVQHIQHLKSTQITILTELERLVQENEQLKRFQQSVLQKQVMDSIYPLQ